MLAKLISSLLPRFSFSVETFFTGEFCGSTDFSSSGNMGHLHFIRRGPVVMEHDDGLSITATEPTIIFYPQGFKHRLFVPPGTRADLICANVVFREASRNPFVLALPDGLRLPLANATGFEEVVHLLHAEVSKKELAQRFVIDRLCDILVFQVILHAVNTGNLKAGVLAGLTDPGIAQALTAIHQDAARDWHIEDLAREAAMSRSKFAKRFHELVAMTPANYLADWRLSLAENLLKQNYSVKAVARAVGYGTQSSLTRAFILRRNQSPTQWLTEQRKILEAPYTLDKPKLGKKAN